MPQMLGFIFGFVLPLLAATAAQEQQQTIQQNLTPPTSLPIANTKLKPAAAAAIATPPPPSTNDISCPKHTSLNGRLAPTNTLLSEEQQLVQEELCSHEDRGTCGNACCTIQAESSKGCDTQCAMALISKMINDHTFDGLTIKNVTNLKSLVVVGANDVEYLISALRTGPDGRNQNLLFSIGSSDLNPGQAVVKGFSESKAIGSYRDYGQNYRNLVEVFRGVGGGGGGGGNGGGVGTVSDGSSSSSWASSVVLIHGCGRNGKSSSE
jgi:hypothetical protein